MNDWLVDWLIHYLIDWLIDWLIFGTIKRSHKSDQSFSIALCLNNSLFNIGGTNIPHQRNNKIILGVLY